jgi:hypothetical protein
MVKILREADKGPVAEVAKKHEELMTLTPVPRRKSRRSLERAREGQGYLRRDSSRTVHSSINSLARATHLAK